MLCSYGCGNEAYFYSKWNKTYRCTIWPSSCPAVRKKTSHPSWCKGLTGTFTGKTHTQETKDSISSSMKGNRNANHRGDRQSFYKNIRMDSKWEVGTAKYLDSISVDWKYNEHGYKLSDGRYYYPDFFIYENNLLVKIIEVKGYFRENNRQKFDMFLTEYPTVPIELWQRNKLTDLKIINASGYLY
jgi:hypothetical protein